MNFYRPIVKLSPSKTDNILDRISLTLLLLVWIYSIVQFYQLPAIIPVHFNLNGNIDGYGSKSTIFLLPGIITIVFFGMTILNRYPHIFHYPGQITPENAMSQYSKATRLMRILKLIIVVFTSILIIDIVQSAKTKYSGLPWWIVILFMVSMIIPVIISIFSFSKKRI